MSGRIITVRHGRPDLARDMRITSAQYGEWWAQYDASGLHADERPPQALIDFAAKANLVLSSSLPRAVETAAWATGGAREVPADPLYMEAPLPPPPVPFIKLRPGTWGVVSRTFWILGYAPEGVESHMASWGRVREITGRLADFAREGDVVLCAHGFLNWMIDRRLRKEGWARIDRAGRNHFWSWRVYEREGQRSAVEAPAAAE